MKIREGFGQTRGPRCCWRPSRGSSRARAPWASPRPLLRHQAARRRWHTRCADGEEGAICVTGLKEAVSAGAVHGLLPRSGAHGARLWAAKYYNLHDMAWRDYGGLLLLRGPQRRRDQVLGLPHRALRGGERAASTHPTPCVECAVTAAPDPIRGKVVKATIVLAKGYEPSDELMKELQNHVKQHDGAVQVPAHRRVRGRAAQDHRRQDQAQAHPQQRRHRGLARGRLRAPPALAAHLFSNPTFRLLLRHDGGAARRKDDSEGAFRGRKLYASGDNARTWL